MDNPPSSFKKSSQRPESASFRVSQKRIQPNKCLFLYLLEIIVMGLQDFVTGYVLFESRSTAKKHFTASNLFHKNEMHWLLSKTFVKLNARMNTNG